MELFARLNASIRSSSLARKVLVLAGGSVIAQGITVVVTVLLARIYDPSDFGVLTVYSSVLGVLCIVATFRYDLAIPLPRSDGAARVLTNLAIVVALGLAAVVAVVFGVAGDQICAALGSPRLASLWWMVPVGVAGGGLYAATSGWALRHRAYREIAKTRVIRSVASSAASAGLPFVVGGPLGLLAGAVISLSLGSWQLAKVQGGLRDPGRTWDELSAMRRHGREYLQFAAFSSVAALLNSAGLIGPVLIFSHVYGEVAVGYFGFAQRIMLIPMVLIGSAVAQVFTGEGAVLVRERPEALPEFFRSTIKKLLPLALVVLAGGLLCPLLFPFVFGRGWREAGIYAFWMSPACAAQVVISPISTITVIAKRQGWQLVLDLIRACLVLCAILVPSIQGCGPDVAVRAYSIAMLAVYVITYFVCRSILSGKQCCSSL